MNKYPKINYIGNKEKIAEWIIDCLPVKNGKVVDLFCGGCSVSYALKAKGYEVLSNDILYANYVIAKAIIENNDDILLPADFSIEPDSEEIAQAYDEIKFLENKIYFEAEMPELARLVAISKRLNGNKKYIFLALLRRAMIRKIPYSRMNIKWEEIVKLRDEEYSYKKYGRYRHYHNISFTDHINDNLAGYNNAVINKNTHCVASNMDALEFVTRLDEKVDIVYIDPPYPSTMNDYDSFYGAFDRALGAAHTEHIDLTGKDTFLAKFYDILEKCVGKSEYAVISLNNKCYPSQELLTEHINDLLEDCKIFTANHTYKVTGKENKNTNYEILLLCKLKKELG